MKVITIGREYGAGGHSIGRKVAEKLGLEFYDRDIISECAKQSGIEPQLVEKMEEDISRTDDFLRSILPVSYDQKDVIRDIEKSVILSLAQKGPCVILGRGANAVLKEAGIDTLDVFIYADEVHRALRVGEIIGSSNATEIQKAMKKKDFARNNYYTHYTGSNWRDCHNYALMLDSGVLGYDACADMICAAAKSAE